MATAALYDIHGNLPALEAVLQKIEQLNIDRILVGGDVILGPMSCECLDLLLNLSVPTHFILGNCEVSVLAQMEKKLDAQLPEAVLEDIRWTAGQLTAHHRRSLSEWPKSLRFEIKGIGQVLFCHATPRSETENFTRLTPEEKLRPIFDDLDVDLVVCGHTHMQFDRQVGGVRIVNAGSVGMPFGKAGAYWLLLEQDVDLKYTSYDLDHAAARIRETDYPHAGEFAQNNVLLPPSEEQMLKVFF